LIQNNRGAAQAAPFTFSEPPPVGGTATGGFLLQGAAMELKSEIEVREFVRRFEQCEIAVAEFSHAAHVVVGTVFICDDPQNALARMRAGLLRFTAHHGKTGVYKEDVTREWIERLRACVNEHPGSSIVDLVNGSVAKFGKSKVPTAS
jgi:hypothetical protein